MSALRRSLSRHLLTLQIATILAVLGAAALFPPAKGKMILIALAPGAEHAMLRTAFAHGAAPVGEGPLPHSFVVFGNRDALAPTLLAHGVLVLAAPPAGCGGFAA